MERTHKKHRRIWIILLCILAVLVILALIFMHFGGFGTGKSANVEQFKTYADTVESLTVPDGARVIALGEATHGNREFQALKRTVFENMVENYGVRAFALEGDYGGCEAVNRYIHGGAGTAAEAAEAIGFAIYRTDEIADLIAYMRAYNDTAAPGDDLRFYGFDMQRCGYTFGYLVEGCKALGVDTTALEPLMNGEDWADGYDSAARTECITKIKTELEAIEGSEQAVHCADMLLQNIQLGAVQDQNSELIMLRDQLMAENVEWISAEEADLGHERIFISGHNGHIARYGSYDMMGKLLDEDMGDAYYAIGTDFYKTTDNMPDGQSGKRTNQTFYSYDPLAVAANKAGFDTCWLDFSKVPEDSELYASCTNYDYLGTLGEGYALYMRLIPMSYREFQPPATMYNSMIFVSNATPIVIHDKTA